MRKALFRHNRNVQRAAPAGALILATLVFAAASPVNPEERNAPAATDVTASQIQEFLNGAPRDRNSDRAIRVIDAGGYRVGIFGVFRPKAAPISAIVHQTNVTETYYMLEGAGVLVTGGTLLQPTQRRPSAMGNWVDVSSSGIEGGTSRRISKGDVVVIPGGVPHGWSSVEGDISYLIVRSDPSKKLPIK